MEWLKDKWNHIKADIRKAHKSLTMWFNGVLGTLLIFWPDIAANVSSVQAYLTPSLYGKLVIALAIGNVILRMKTTQALRDK